MLQELKNDFSALFSKKFIEQRYHLHLSVGAAIGAVLWFITVEAYQPAARILLSTLLTGFAAVGWEFYREMVYKYKTDWADVRFSTYGGFLGCLLTYFIFK